MTTAYQIICNQNDVLEYLQSILNEGDTVLGILPEISAPTPPQAHLTGTSTRIYAASIGFDPVAARERVKRDWWARCGTKRPYPEGC